MDPLLLGPWPHGMDNRRPEHSLRTDDRGNVVSLRNAVNIDLDVAGNARRRSGYELVASGINTRCGFSCKAGVYFVDGVTLMRLNDDDTTTALFNGIAGEVVSYEYLNGVVYLSDGIVTKRITAGSVYDWSIDFHLSDDADYMAIPPGTIVRHHNGRMYVASGNMIWFTDPFTLGSVHRQRNFLQFTSPVSIMEPVSGGIWIVTDETRFYAGGGPEDFTPILQLNYGATPGTAVRVPNSNDVMWYSDRGVVLATSDGQIKNLQEASVAVEVGKSGSAVIREENGIRQFIASVRNQSVSPLAANSFIEMEVVRKQGG